GPGRLSVGRGGGRHRGPPQRRPRPPRPGVGGCPARRRRRRLGGGPQGGGGRDRRRARPRLHRRRGACHARVAVAVAGRGPTRRRVTVWRPAERPPAPGPRPRRPVVWPPPKAGAPASTGVRPPRGGRSPPTVPAGRVGAPRGLAARQRRRQLPGLLRVYPPF